MSSPTHHSCGGCTARWAAATIAHCAACHLTFTGVSAFDEHRKDGRCLTIIETKLLVSARYHDPVYGHPPNEDAGWWKARRSD